MAKNWTVAEVATVINENGTMNENAQDFGRRFPVATSLMVASLAGDKAATLQLLAALPEYVTMSKLEKVFKTAIDEGTPIGAGVSADDEDADAEDTDEEVAEEKPAKPAKKAAKKEAATADADDDLESKTGKELLEIGKELGIPVKAMKSKQMAIDSIREARANGGAMNPPVADEAEETEEAAVDYKNMSAKELYKLCKERGIDAEQKKPTKYYVELLEAADAEDTEEESEVDYTKMTAKELYALCKERGIKAEQKKPAKYYIELLENEGSEEEEQWEEEAEEEAEEEKPAAKPAKKAAAKPKKSEEEEWDI